MHEVLALSELKHNLTKLIVPLNVKGNKVYENVEDEISVSMK